MIRKLMARKIHSLHGALSKPPIRPMITGGRMASAAAEHTTMGVYQRAKRVIYASLLDFLSPEVSTSSKILETVDSPNSFSTRTRSTPFILMQPLITPSPTETSRGLDSPVRATVFRLLAPSMTVPSSGTFSPGLTTMISPTATSSGNTSSTLPSRSTFAVSGQISMSEAIAFLLLPTAMLWNSSPV